MNQIADLIKAAETAATWMQSWIEQAICECEDGHVCGISEREAELAQLKEAIEAARGKKREKAPPHEIPEYIMIKLRRREGLNENDKTRDEKFRALDPAVIFDEIVTWQLGSGGFGNTLLNWARDCGIKIEGR